MDDKLLNYYERELTFVREMGAEFAAKYPKIAGRLQLEPDKCEDPHTERLIEAFAYISGRIHKKIDDDFPQITESLMGITYPHYTNPIPSMTLVRFDPNPKSITEKGYEIQKGAALFSKPVKGVPCTFTLCAPVSLWPVRVKAVSLEEPGPGAKGAVQAIHIQLETVNDIDFSDLECESLRFFLNGQHQHVFPLYEKIFNNVSALEFRFANSSGRTETIALEPESIRPVGFDPNEKMLPYSKRSFPGYLLLFEYFTFPEKFLFFDLTGFKALKKRSAGTSLSVILYLSQSIKRDIVVNKDTFQLHSAPAVNLFKKIAEPMRVEHRKTEYRVVPDLRRAGATEVYTVDRVKPASVSAGQAKEYRPFYSIRHHLSHEEAGNSHVFWHIQRRPSGRQGDKGTEVYLSFSDLNMTPADPGADILTIHQTCTNRDLPSRLPFGDERGDFTMELAAPVDRIVSMIKPTPTRRPFLGGALQWRMISHLSLNYISMVEGGEDALKEILKLYDFENSTSTKQQISGIVSVQSRHVTKRIRTSFARGVEITLTLDEDKFVGSGLFLFASILERFLAQYVSVNSFSQLVLKTLQKKEEMKRWPPRSGNQILV
ncbi:type VI secretion system baseplate subunit TssF [Desulfospira joergensenii]|uniref:type VI secretion system baseplate subunit TssF n=1 Tax=Desulfospira joergensenii TaxID=53329 RepID=UPI0003B32CA1|nr:type VI secretion system baseplate subunit TssF [Desulfospira joergensenii]